MKRSHILTLVSDLYFGGDETRLLNFALTADRERFSHTIITIKGPGADPDRSAAMRKHYEDAGILVEDLGEGRYPITVNPDFVPDNGGERAGANGHPPAGPRQLISAARVFARSVGKLRRLIRDRRASILDARGEVAAGIALSAGKLTGIPTAVTCYHTYIWDRPFMRVPGQLTLGFADAVITDSASRARLLENWLWRKRSPIVVIPNGIHRPEVHRPAREVRATLGLPSDESGRIVAQIGGLVVSKGQWILLDAARIVLGEVPDAVFLMIGWGRGDRNRDALRKRAAELGIAERVVVTSYPGPIGDVWNVVDVHVHASLYDSLPVAVQEGMSWGKPAVVTSVGGIPEMVTNEQTGLVVPPGDSRALAEAILRLLSEPVTAERLGRAAAQRYDERYRPEAMTRAIEDLFLELIGR